MAAAAPTCNLVPQLRDVMVSQGVGSYSVLAQGKDGIARLFLSLPSCAPNGAGIQVTNGSGTVTGGTTGGTLTPTPVPATPYPYIAPYVSAPSTDSPADLKLLVPGSALRSTATTGFTSTYSFTVNYQSIAKSGATPVPGTVTFTQKPGTTLPITAAVNAPSNNLRVLVQPLGNASDASGIQNPAAATPAAQNAISALSRILPVANGIGDLATPGNGIRWQLAPNLMDIGPAGGNVMTQSTDGTYRYCIEGSSWATVSSLLSSQLAAWNSTHASPDATADVIIGVLWTDVANVVNPTTQVACADGMSTLNSRQAIVRLAPDGAAPSPSGGFMAHEILHTRGGIPTGQDSPNGSHHTTAVTADGTAPNRAYNVTTRQYLATNRTVMDQTDNWNNVTTLFEPRDWAYMLCSLTPGATGCTSPGATGTALVSPFDIHLTGTIDNAQVTAGVVNGTTVDLESYVEPGQKTPEAAVGAGYQLVQTNAANQTLAFRFNVNDEAVDSTGFPAKNVDISVGLMDQAVRFDVYKAGNATPIYTRFKNQVPIILNPRNDYEVTSSRNLTPTPAANQSYSSIRADGTVAYSDETGIHIRPFAGGPESASTVAGGSQPSWSPDGSQLAYRTNTGNIATVTWNGSTFGSPQLRYCSGLSVLNLTCVNGSAVASHPSFGNDGTLVFEQSNSIYRVGPTSLVNPDGAVTCPLLAGLIGFPDCKQIIANGTAPSVSPANVVAYVPQGSGDTWQANIDGSGQVLLQSAATQPTWGGPAASPILGYMSGTQIWVRGADGIANPVTILGDSWPSIDPSGTRIGWTHTDGTPQSDVFVGTLGRSPLVTIRVTDDGGCANIRLDVFTTTNGGGNPQPVRTDLSPTRCEGNTAVFVLPPNPTVSCQSCQLMYRANDGWNAVRSLGDPIASTPHAPTAAIYSTPVGSEWNEKSLIPLDGFCQDAEDGVLAGTSLVWTRSVVNGTDSTAVAVGSGRHVDVTGLAPGTYIFRLSCTDSSGQVAFAEVTTTVYPDTDNDGIRNSLDKCNGVDLSGDPSNGYVDPTNCMPPNCTVNMAPNTVNVANDSGNPIQMSISCPTVDLRTIPISSMYLVDIAGQPIPWIAAYSLQVQSASAATVKFPRATVDAVLRSSSAFIGPAITFTMIGSNATQSILATGTTATCSGNKCPMT